MKAGMILGIIGGVIALLVGAVGYSASSALGSLSSGIGYEPGASSAQFYSIMSLVLPVAGLLGGGIVGRNAQIGAGLMGLSAVGILWAFGLSFLSIVPAVLLGLGAFLVLSEGESSSHENS